MIIRATELLSRMFDEGTPKEDRLVITPILDREAQIHPGSASIDVRLGRNFTIPKKPKISRFDPLDENIDKNIKQSFEKVFIDFGRSYILHPHHFVLGSTLEWIKLPSDLAAYVIGRSSWGRIGLIIATATGVHPNYTGVLTLEITNLGEIPLYLYPGMRIAQLFFHEVKSDITQGKDVSQFSASTDPEPKNPMNEKDREVLKKFKPKREKDSG